MKQINTFACMLIMATTVFSTACENDNINPVSYTHLTLPTILLV